MPSGLDPDRQLYPNAPLQLVACEVTYTLAPGANLDAARDAMYGVLGETYPLPALPPAPGLTVQIGGAGPIPQIVQGFRFLNLERTESVSVSPLSVVLETSRYHRFENFRERVVEALAALGDAVRIAAVTRIGLRYIDEVPLADLPSGSFEGYFAESLLAPGEPVPDVGEPVEYLTTSRYAVAQNQHTTMRTGMLTAPVVSPEGPLFISRPTAGAYFLIDIDSAWEAGAPATPPLPFDTSAVVDVLGALHAPVRALFERAITPRLRVDVLRKETPA